MRIIHGAFNIVLAVGLVSGLMKTAAAAQENPSNHFVSEPYIWENVVIGGGGFVTAIITHPTQKGLMYARTDVGGAYRWDDSTKRWIPITDWIGMADINLTGIESLAIDPSDPNRIYLAAGTYSNPQSGNGAILRSTDQGRTWERTDMPLKMGGNETGRFNGERLAVDPNDGKILFFGSRHNGLWKSLDYGAIWNQVKNFPTTGKISTLTNGFTPNNFSNNFYINRSRFNFPPQQVGLVFVQFDSRSGARGNPTRVIYVGVSILDTNLFRSTDGGDTWHAVPGQPIGLRPNHAVLTPDGMMYLSYGKEPGPNTMTDGAVWKFNTKNSEWMDITPIKPATADQPFGYGAIAVDATHPNTIVATTFCHWHPHDEIFRSTNSGANWSPLLENAEFDHSFAPYTKAINPHWMGSIQIDPFDSNHVLFTTGYGIWSCDDLTDADSGKPTHWTFADNGLEETVPLDLISPPEGAHLLSALGDIDGFKHDDLNATPREGAFRAPPRFVNTASIAFAAEKPTFIVRSGTTSARNNRTHGTYSLDGGETWNSFASEPSENAGTGVIAVSADSKTIVWTLRRSAPNFSRDNGATWTTCGNLPRNLRVVADSVNPNKFYAFDSHSGKFYLSTNGAADFAATEPELPVAESFGNGFGAGSDGGVVCATPGNEGDIWINFRIAGLYHSTNSGSAFAKLGNVQQAYSLGFGKTVSGGKYPALYLIGKISDVQAVFRSVDSGVTWARINDDQHQFGWISHVTGDPRIYGRVYFATGGRGVIYGDPVKPKNWR
ncbi:MAG: cellulase [Verrucomicrobiota bacterium]